MAKITSKLQITIPKRLAEQYGMVPGDEVEFLPAGDSMRLVPARSRARQQLSPDERLRLFDAATTRQIKREKTMALSPEGKTGRDWDRADLYTRGKPD
ncbi:MAG: AbrB/MazE/SpoVT family DNA-binding domain-containing protein [Woeseia sp.]